MVIGYLIPFFILLALLHLIVRAGLIRLAPSQYKKIGDTKILRGFLMIVVAAIPLSIWSSSGFVEVTNQFFTLTLVNWAFFVFVGLPLIVFLVDFKNYRLIVYFLLVLAIAGALYVSREHAVFKDWGITSERLKRGLLDFSAYVTAFSLIFYCSVFWQRTNKP